jgi:hypothetical protein
MQNSLKNLAFDKKILPYGKILKSWIQLTLQLIQAVCVLNASMTSFKLL